MNRQKKDNKQWDMYVNQYSSGRITSFNIILLLSQIQIHEKYMH